jgi:hypothetical protein
MRISTPLLTLCASALAASTAELIDSTEIFIQVVESTSTLVNPLAEIKYNPSTLSAELISFEPPSLPDDSSSLVRIGIYDIVAAAWKSSTSVTSVESFAKGYAPTFVLNLDAQGAVIGVSVKSGKIDAGQTRDFGPKVLVRKMGKGKVPELNRPVVLSPEGKVEEPEPEKTMLQK